MNPSQFYSFKKLLIFGEEGVGKTSFKTALENDSTDKFNEEYKRTEKGILYLYITHYNIQ